MTQVIKRFDAVIKYMIGKPNDTFDAESLPTTNWDFPWFICFGSRYSAYKSKGIVLFKWMTVVSLVCVMIYLVFPPCVSCNQCVTNIPPDACGHMLQTTDNRVILCLRSRGQLFHNPRFVNEKTLHYQDYSKRESQIDLPRTELTCAKQLISKFYLLV